MSSGDTNHLFRSFVLSIIVVKNIEPLANIKFPGIACGWIFPELKSKVFSVFDTYACYIVSFGYYGCPVFSSEWPAAAKK
ncbi:hypothetical protein DU68_05325 [Methanosarcina mazei]|jgi:hypothetical protein|uniref:Uncharacterized protein n=1 Tax=Methanosarcina mazei TaxID=2209 RepID=A0A0F8JJI8_METMZ|nr:hypothetical protein DU33_06035 [Methanosarcina mazei]KKG57849.1 hypothetical protein DU45_03190 [Methanosarcina mazei]KKG66883.1 hypothetical protein DU64_04290 [Methanosarcina mazei]KKH01164.1 hypothetical protein DU68_05325 [Methanosarcina mazei]KKH01567.1 hypothetical protein DU56_05085 [Methanosarcina mazei]